MGGERKEDLVSRPCDWCSGSSSLNVGTGIFRDFDWEPMAGILTGIPICGGCGGTGLQFDNDDFKARRETIMDLRFKFADEVEAKNPSQQLKVLQQLETEVKELVNIYGNGSDKSFANTIVNGELSKRIEYLKNLL